MKFRPLFILPLIALVPALAAASAKTYKNRKTRVSFSHPPEWTVSENGDEVSVTSSEGAASVKVSLIAGKDKTTACEILKARGEEQKMVNLLPDEKRTVTPEQLRFLGVKDGCLAAYELTEADGDTLVGVGVYISGKKIWVLEQRLKLSAREKYAADISSVAVSFTTN